MARNKYPEETVKKILDVSYRLFLEKGYDHTTIQDITDALGMSKGAVYHHFKSKEDILDKISDRYYDDMGWFQEVRLDPTLSGLDKIRMVLTSLLSDPTKLELDRMTIKTTMDPKLVDLTLRSTVHDSAPFMEALIREGIEDGSVAVKSPKEFSEVFMLIMNMWVGIFSTTKEDFMSKIAFIKDYTERMGLPVIDDALMEVCADYYDRILSLQSQPEPREDSPSSLKCELNALKQDLSKELIDLKKELSQLKHELTHL